jgi:hypothetical protein
MGNKDVVGLDVSVDDRSFMKIGNSTEEFK